MSKSSSDTHLKYGQGILIKGYKSQSNGILTTKGFADTRARFQTYDDILYFKNYRNAIFQILPASSFDNNDELKYLIENNIENKGNNLNILLAKAKSEKEQFDLTINSKKTSQVCFGDQIVLKHIDSGTYLSGTITPAQGKNGAFSVQVTKDLKTSLIFKLLPYRSFENQSNPIPLESPIIIENVFNKGFLTFQRFGLIEKKQKRNKFINSALWEKQPIKSDDSYKIPVKTDSTNSQIYECVTHFSDLSIKQIQEQMPWKFELHFSEVENDNLIQHDIVYFQHTLNNGVLSAYGEDEIVLKELKGDKTSELNFYSCLWEIEQLKQQGEHSYILRHLMSGMTLGVDYTKTGDTQIPSKPKLIDISDGKSNDDENNKLGVIELKLAKKQGGQISSKSYINICCGESCLDIIAREQRQKQPNKRDQDPKIYEPENVKTNENKKQFVDLNEMALISNNEFDFEIKKLHFTMDISKHCFVIQQIEDELKSEVLFALSFHSRLINLREDLKWGAEESEKKVTYLRMMQITQKTKQIKYFLKNTSNDDPNREFKRPVAKRQIICFHLGISELLFELLHFMRKNRDGELGVKDGKTMTGVPIFKHKPNEYQKFIEMYNAIYEVIYELIRDNTQFKIHVSKWISFIFQDVIRDNEEYHLKTLLELLKNNYFFVNNFVTENLVVLLVDRMLNDPNQKQSNEFFEKKYLEIFRAFCICGDEVNSDNQVLILNKFIKKIAENPENSIFEIKLSKRKNQETKQEQLVCSAASDKHRQRQRKFGQYYKICKDEFPTAWSYMISYLNLIADMCRGRNKIVENYIDTTMSSEVIAELITKQTLFDAQVPIIRIMHYLYAENQNFYPIDRITRVLDNDHLDDEIKLNSTKSQVRPKALLGSVMTSLIQKLQSYGPLEIKQDPQESKEEMKKHEKLYVILDFLRETFILGFWEEKTQVSAIYQAISKIIQPAILTDYNKITNQSQKPEIMLMFSCKQKCMEILELILDLDIDLYLKCFCRTFKKFIIPERKLEVTVSDFLEVTEDSKFSIDFLKQFKEQRKVLSPIVFTQICPKIIELSKLNHPKLTSLSLRILERVLDFSRHISMGFIRMVFVCEKNRKELHKFISDRRDKFFTLEYQNTTKISLANQKSLFFMMYRDQKDAGIMQDLYMISQLVKKQNSLQKIREIKTFDSSGTFKDLAGQKLVNFTSERRSSDIMKQQVVDASDIHEKVLKYVFNCKQIPKQSLAIKLLHLCYRFLVSIIENNQQLKLTLIPHIPKIIHHIQKNVGCIDFLKEMYDNNRNMLYNDMDILKLIKKICYVINNINKKSKEFIDGYDDGVDMNVSRNIIQKTDEVKKQDEYRNLFFYRSKLLDFFRYLIYCNGRTLHYNQIQILKIMQDDNFSHIMIEITPQKIQDLVREYSEQNKGDAQEGPKVIKMKHELTYVVTFFQNMVSLIDDKCKVNSGKLIKKFPFEKLVQFIEKADKCWPLKRNLRAFLNRLYYDEPQIDTYMSTIRSKEIENIIKDMNYFIEIKVKANVVEFQALCFENPVRFSYLESYLYLNLQENLITLKNIVKNHKLVAEFKTFLHSAKNDSKKGPYNFIKICERLGWIRNYFIEQKNIFTTSFIKFLLSEFKLIIDEFDDNVYSDGMMFSGDKVPTKQEKDRARTALIEKILLGEIKTFFVQGSPEINGEKPLVYQTPPKFTAPKDKKQRDNEKLMKKLRQILTRTKRDFENKDEQILDKQTRLIRALKLSKQVKQQFGNIYNERLQQITNLTVQFEKQMIKNNKLQQERREKEKQDNPESTDSQFTEQRQKKEENGQDINNECPQEFRSLLKYVSQIIHINSSDPDVFEPEIKIFFLKMIIGIVEQSNKTKMQVKKPIDEWQGQDWQQSLQDVQIIQCQLKKSNVGTLIAQILKQNIIDNIPLANSILLCGISYLMGGNTVTQQNLIAQIKKDPDNKVFRNIKNLITKLGKIILKNIDETNLKPVQSEQFQVNTIDNYDFYDEAEKYCLRKNVFEPSSTNEEIYHKECIITYRRAFKFLQLLCENNNQNNKKYIKDQKGKMDPVNFISVATNQLRNLFGVMCKQIVDVPLFLLDFLLEVTQIPIQENQRALMNSSFFEDLCQMANQFTKAEKIAERNFDDKKNHPLQQIYLKSVQIILSNFEGNDMSTFYTLQSKLDPKFLVNILESKFKSLEISNKQDLLEYIKLSLESVDESGNKIISPKFPPEIMGIFDILMIFMKLKQKLENSNRLYGSYAKFKAQSEDHTQMLDYLENSLIHIEINDLKDKTQTIYFAKHPCFYSLSNNIRDFVMSKVKRDSHRDKIVSLIGYSSTIKQSIEDQYKLDKSEEINESNMRNSYNNAATMSVVICVYMLMFYGVIIQYGDVEFTSNRIYRSFGFVLSLIQLSMSICYFYYWRKLKAWREPEYKSKQKAETGSENPVTKQPQQKIYNSKDFYRLLLFIIVSFVGTFIDPTVFFIHIIDIFCQSPQLASVFEAITSKIKDLFLVSIMGVIFVVVFCTVTFSNYTKDIYGQKQLKHPERLCDSMLSCLLSLQVSGSIGQSMQVFQMQRFIYDMIYIIFFSLLFGNIISGIMLDAFSNLREKNEELQMDKQNVCYICDIKRESLQKRKIPFKQHIVEKHLLWNYVFYIISLNMKNKTDYTGLEYYIFKQYNEPDDVMKIDWIPLGDKGKYEAVQDLKKINDKVDSIEMNIQEKRKELGQAVKDFLQNFAEQE